MAKGYRICPLRQALNGVDVKFCKGWYGSCDTSRKATTASDFRPENARTAQIRGDRSGMDRALVLNNVKSLTRGNLGIPLMLMGLLGMMILPMPAFLLDVFFTFNITLSIVILLVCVYAMRLMEFASFPTVLLVATLLRLGLNVASTRIVLLNGHEGGDAAGKVIESFGEVLIGGNYAVGLVVFAILMIINFLVVTKGAGRVSEVSARFTLDAMPGKQMAIDADLNAGLINQDEAKSVVARKLPRKRIFTVPWTVPRSL